MYKIYHGNLNTKNWIVTIAIGKSYLQNFERYALASWQKYCKFHDIGILAVTGDLISKDNPSWKKANWQKLLIPKLLMKEIPGVNYVCYLDTDILINPYAPNIFDSYDGCSYGLVSRVENLPMPLNLVQRQFVYLRNRFYDSDYPLDSGVFMPLNKQYEFSNLPPLNQAACTGVILFNPSLVFQEMYDWFYKYKISDVSVTDGEQTHLNYEILNTGKVQWFQYEFQAIWVYEMAWKYPFLYGQNSKNKELIIDCIEASLFSNYFLHFGGSWHESEMWLTDGIANGLEFEVLNEGFSRYLKTELKGESLGRITPSNIRKDI